MKKLMIALGAVAIAAGVQAATLQWSFLGAPASGTKTSGYTAFLVDAKGYSTIDAVVAAIMADGASADGVIASANAMYNSGAVRGGKTDSSWVLPQKGVDKEGNPIYYQGGDYIDSYTILFDGSVGEGATAANYLTATPTADHLQISSAGKYAAAYTNLSGRTWTAVAPEPTSGMLLLLGMGALALRRRRA